MPKEQPCLSECSQQSAASSKNAKDKSNSTMLLAMRGGKDAGDAGGRGSRCSSEKDSGFSDGSDWQQTDVEDQRQNKNHCRGSERAELSPPDQHRENPGNPSLMPGGSELSTIYIIKNMVLNQPDTSQKRNHLPRRSGSREAGSPGAAHMMLLQQPSLLLATLQLHKPSSRKAGAAEKKINGTYLPILNSYPRIAPHPSKKPPDKSPPRDESHNLSKRVCTEHKSDSSPALRSLLEQHLTEQVVTSGPPCSSSSSSSRVYLPSSISPSLGSSSGSSMCTNSSFASNRALHRSSCVSTRHRRFLNTVQVLRQSGLLDITLRTKELLRQSNATERDIAQLRQHTELLCRAAGDPGRGLNDPAAFEQLHRAMVQSGCYPNVGALQDLQERGAGRPESAAAGPGLAKGPETGPPLTSAPEQNCPVPQQPHSGRSGELQVASKHSEKVTFMPPDSSTG